MRARNRIFCLSMLLVLALLSAGCPNGRNGTITLYILNQSDSPIETVEVLNQDTGVLDTINDDPVPAGTVVAFHLSSATYASPSTNINYESVAGQFSSSRSGVSFESDTLLGFAESNTDFVFMNPLPVTEVAAKGPAPEGQ